MKKVYDMYDVQFYHGSAYNLDALPDGKIHMVITSPPYFNARDYSVWKAYDQYLDAMLIAWKECYRVMGNGARIAVNVPMGYGRPGADENDIYLPIGNDITSTLLQAHFKLRGHIIWDKGASGLSTAWGSWRSARNPSLRDCYEIIIVAHKGSYRRDRGSKKDTATVDDFSSGTNSIWRVAPVSSWHPAPFPPELPRRLIQLYTFTDDTILDPFAGSGTTLWEASKAGRKAIGVEQNISFIEQACGSMFVEKTEEKADGIREE